MKDKLFKIGVIIILMMILVVGLLGVAPKYIAEYRFKRKIELQHELQQKLIGQDSTYVLLTLGTPKKKD